MRYIARTENPRSVCYSTAPVNTADEMQLPRSLGISKMLLPMPPASARRSRIPRITRANLSRGVSVVMFYCLPISRVGYPELVRRKIRSARNMQFRGASR